MVVALAAIAAWAGVAHANQPDWRHYAFGKPKIEEIFTNDRVQPFQQSDVCATTATPAPTPTSAPAPTATPAPGAVAPTITQQNNEIKLPIKPDEKVKPFQLGSGGIWDTLPIPGSPTPIPPWNPYGYGSIVDTIVNVGKTLWAVVEANRPVVNIQSSFATALPKGSEDWTSLECWSRPVSRTFKVTYGNWLKKTPVSFEFKVVYNYGGRKDGVGRFLNNVTIVPSSLYVGWGYKFSAETVVGNVMNAGPAANPVAALELQLNWSLETVLKHVRESETFYIRGDGYFEKVAKETPPVDKK